jgi:hypothetical protein
LKARRISLTFAGTGLMALSHSRTSPPGTLREGNHTSSFPIHHPGGLGSSPVKTSALAKRLDEEMEI